MNEKKVAIELVKLAKSLTASSESDASFKRMKQTMHDNRLRVNEIINKAQDKLEEAAKYLEEWSHGYDTRGDDYADVREGLQSQSETMMYMAKQVQQANTEMHQAILEKFDNLFETLPKKMKEQEEAFRNRWSQK